MHPGANSLSIGVRCSRCRAADIGGSAASAATAPAVDAEPRARRPVTERTDRVERLAYTRQQAAEALGISLATLDRRVVPVIETVETRVGRTPDPGRRARALPRRTQTTSRQAPRTAANARAAARPRAGSRRAHPARVRGAAQALAEIARAAQRRRRPDTSQGGASGGHRRCAPFSSVRVRRRPAEAPDGSESASRGRQT